MHANGDLLGRLVLGAAGGFLGTVAIQGLMAASQKYLPESVPPLRKDPGKFMVEKLEEALPDAVRGHVPDAVEAGAAKGLAVGYGVTFGALYAALRPQGGKPLLDGMVLGAACWAVGYLGWLPALGLMSPVWKQKAPQALASLGDHVVYGITAVAAYDWLRREAEESAPAEPAGWSY